MSCFLIIFSILVQVTVQVNLDHKFFDTHCDQEFVFNPTCIQRRWSYPTCVPWDTSNCRINRNKGRNYCINYDCSVSFFSRDYQEIVSRNFTLKVVTLLIDDPLEKKYSFSNSYITPRLPHFERLIQQLLHVRRVFIS